MPRIMSRLHAVIEICSFRRHLAAVIVRCFWAHDRIAPMIAADDMKAIFASSPRGMAQKPPFAPDMAHFIKACAGERPSEGVMPPASINVILISFIFGAASRILRRALR